MKDTIRSAEILITIETEITENKLIQKFFYDKKEKKYLTDPFYLLYEKFETKLRQHSLSNENVNFLQRINDNGVVILVYEIINPEIKIDKSRKMFTLADFVPPTNGCAFCRYKKTIDENFFYCEYKEKTMAKEIKKCGYFKQRQLYKT